MRRTEQELKDASGHVKYEIDMLVGTMSFLSKPAAETHWIASSAYLESLVLHLRNLIDFFYTPSTRDDIVAEHFVAQWTADCPVMSPLLDDAKERANKLCAHLTYTRLHMDKTWEWAAIWAELKQVIRCFVSHLPAERKPWFADASLEEPSGPTGTSSLPVVRGWTGPPGPPDPEKAKTSE